jgi:wyosine [tRNA(Phe)-imidazoG37] synthetase (radical SAM superfamily)
MKEMLSGLSTINIELSSRCNKECWCCGRRKIDRDFPDIKLKYGDMPFDLLEIIASQLPPNIVVQLHNNGEPTLYPRLGDAIRLFKKQITQFDTNGKLIVQKADEIVGKLDAMAIS